MRSIIVASLLALSGSAAAVQPGIYQTRGTVPHDQGNGGAAIDGPVKYTVVR